MLKTRIGEMELDGVFTNGSGANDDTLEKLLQIAESSAGFITTKTTTVEMRPGNPGPRFYILPNATINSMGWPNSGYKKMLETIKELKSKTKKPVFASVGGFTVEETELLVSSLSEAADVIELNLSCPNVGSKHQVIYNPEKCEQVIRAARKKCRKKLAVKAAHFPDAYGQEAFCEIAKKEGVDIIVAINTIGNSMYIDADSQRIMLKQKWGGLGGEPLKMLGWGNVRRYYEYLKGSIPIVGCGGISSGKDAFAYALAGASAFASASTLYKEGPSCFARMESELEEMLKKHGYSSLQEAVGKAKEF